MPTLTLTISYDGSDAEITQALSRMVAALGKGPAATEATVQQPPMAPQYSTRLDKVAAQFASHTSRTPRLTTVMKLWLRADGKALLSDLWKASGVQKQHDYSGINSALARNMKKVGGPVGWYHRHEQPSGDWVYEIADELLGPLKRAFGV